MGIFKRNKEEEILFRTTSWAEYLQFKKSFNNKVYKTISHSATCEGGEILYTVVYEKRKVSVPNKS